MCVVRFCCIFLRQKNLTNKSRKIHANLTKKSRKIHAKIHARIHARIHDRIHDQIHTRIHTPKIQGVRQGVLQAQTYEVVGSGRETIKCVKSMGGMQLVKKVTIRLQRGAPIQLPSAAKLILFLKNCIPPIDLVHFREK